jgi:hypothetical protein
MDNERIPTAWPPRETSTMDQNEAENAESRKNEFQLKLGRISNPYRGDGGDFQDDGENYSRSTAMRRRNTAEKQRKGISTLSNPLRI